MLALEDLEEVPSNQSRKHRTEVLSLKGWKVWKKPEILLEELEKNPSNPVHMYVYQTEAVQTWHAQETSLQKDTSVVNLD